MIPHLDRQTYKSNILLKMCSYCSIGGSVCIKVFLCFSMNSWSNWTPNDSFWICLSWEIWNMLYLIKFWIRYLRLRLKINFSSTFYWPGPGQLHVNSKSFHINVYFKSLSDLELELEIINLLNMKITEIWTICYKNASVHHQKYQYQHNNP